MAGIAVLLCSCDGKIGAEIDLGQVAEDLRADPNVVELVEHAQLCSPDGLELFEALAEGDLDGILVAACSQDLFAVTFLPALGSSRLRPHQVASLDLRVPGRGAPDIKLRSEAVLARARRLMASLAAAEKDDRGEIVRRALVIGGGVAGIQAALDIANSGYEVVVEREPSIGGHMWPKTTRWIVTEELGTLFFRQRGGRPAPG